MKSKNYRKQMLHASFVTMKQLFTNVVHLSILCVVNRERNKYDTVLFHGRIVNYDQDKTSSFVSEDRSLFNYRKKIGRLYM